MYVCQVLISSAVVRNTVEVCINSSWCKLSLVTLHTYDPIAVCTRTFLFLCRQYQVLRSIYSYVVRPFSCVPGRQYDVLVVQFRSSIIGAVEASKSANTY